MTPTPGQGVPSQAGPTAGGPTQQPGYFPAQFAPPWAAGYWTGGHPPPPQPPQPPGLTAEAVERIVLSALQKERQRPDAAMAPKKTHPDNQGNGDLEQFDVSAAPTPAIAVDPKKNMAGSTQLPTGPADSGTRLVGPLSSSVKLADRTFVVSPATTLDNHPVEVEGVQETPEALGPVPIEKSVPESNPSLPDFFSAPPTEFGPNVQFRQFQSHNATEGAVGEKLTTLFSALNPVLQTVQDQMELSEQKESNQQLIDTARQAITGQFMGKTSEVGGTK